MAFADNSTFALLMISTFVVSVVATVLSKPASNSIIRIDDGEGDSFVDDDDDDDHFEMLELDDSSDISEDDLVMDDDDDDDDDDDVDVDEVPMIEDNGSFEDDDVLLVIDDVADVNGDDDEVADPDASDDGYDSQEDTEYAVSVSETDSDSSFDDSRDDCAVPVAPMPSRLAKPTSFRLPASTTSRYQQRRQIPPPQRCQQQCQQQRQQKDLASAESNPTRRRQRRRQQQCQQQQQQQRCRVLPSDTAYMSKLELDAERRAQRQLAADQELRAANRTLARRIGAVRSTIDSRNDSEAFRKMRAANAARSVKAKLSSDTPAVRPRFCF